MRVARPTGGLADFPFDSAGARGFILCVVILAKRDYLHIDCTLRLRDRIVKTKGSSKDQTNKVKYMSDHAFAALRKALEEALAFELGKRRMHVTRIRAPR